jgi:DNA replication initiation complex subunit (GINS family)
MIFNNKLNTLLKSTNHIILDCMMSIDVLSQQLSTEQDIDALNSLPVNFMADAKQYIQHLQEDLKNTYDYREQMMIRDEEKSAMILLEGITDRRFAKLINISLIYSIGGHNIDPNTLSSVDREAFDLLVQAIKDARFKLES